jgi:hypothetical protein
MTAILIIVIIIIIILLLSLLLFSTDKEKTQIHTCGSGYYINDNSLCIICPIGFYCPGNGNSYGCIDGASVSLKEGNFRCNCVQGYNYDESNNMCIRCEDCLGDTDICPSTKILNEELNNCVCEIGHYLDNNNECKICPTGSYCPDRINERICSSGLLTDREGMTACYCPNGSRVNSSGECEECGNGVTCINGAAVCFTNSVYDEDLRRCKCITGTYKEISDTDDMLCELCPTGYVCPGNENLQLCAAGSIASMFSSTCDTCITGYYKENGICTMCPTNYRCPGGNNDKISCTESFNIPDHPNPTINPTPNTLHTRCYCGTGYYIDENNNCIECPSGYYCRGDNTVIECPQGKISQKRSGYCYCPPGTLTLNSGECTICPFKNHICDGGTTSTDCGTDMRNNNELTACLCHTGYYSTSNPSAPCEICNDSSACPGDNIQYTCPQPTTPSTDKSTCMCPSGSYLQDGHPPYVCNTCPVGYYCPGDNKKYNCPEFSNSIAGRSSCICEAGRFMNSANVCELCSMNHYCPENTNNLIPCPTSANTTGLGSSNIDQCICPNGTLLNSDTEMCVTCPQWTPNGYCRNNYLLLCSVGSRPDPTRSFCLCNAGRYLRNDGICDDCKNGFYCPGDNNRYYCSTETTITGNRATSCTNCRPGYVYNSDTNTCEDCLSGYYCLGGSQPKQMCQAGSHSLPNSNSITDCICNAGSTLDSVTMQCVQCSEQDAPYCYNNIFNPCLIGTDIVSGTCSSSCSLGYYYNDTTYSCEICPLRHYCVNGIKTQCPDPSQNLTQGNSACYCSPGKMLSGSQCVDCIADTNYICPGRNTNDYIRCPPDKISNSSRTACICRPGYMLNTTTSECEPCPENSICLNGIATSCGNLKYLPIGSSTCYCITGYYLNTTTNTCEPCLSGHYCPGDNNLHACISPLTSNSQQGVCDKCINGYVYDTNTRTCNICPIGSYCVNSEIYACPAPSTALSPGSANCSDCISGYFKNNNICTICPFNSYCPGDNSLNVCEEGKTSTQGQTSCSCNRDGYYTNESGQCVQCPVGYYCRNGVRMICQSNSTSTMGQSSCSCNQGYYAEGNNCIQCPAGMFCFGGTSPAQNCIGLTTSNPGSVACNICQPGYYKPDPNVNICERCPLNHKCTNGVDAVPCAYNVGTFDTGSTECRNCNPGHTLVSENECVRCILGHYCLGGNNDPQKCPEFSRVSISGLVSEADCACPQNMVLYKHMCDVPSELSKVIESSDGGKYDLGYNILANLYGNLKIGLATSTYTCGPTDVGFYNQSHIERNNTTFRSKTVIEGLVGNLGGFYIQKMRLAPIVERRDANWDVNKSSRQIYIKYIFLVQNNQVINNRFNLTYEHREENKNLNYLFHNNKPLGLDGRRAYRHPDYPYSMYGEQAPFDTPLTEKDKDTIGIGWDYAPSPILRSLLIESIDNSDIRIDSIIIVFGRTNVEAAGHAGYLSFKVLNTRMFNNANYVYSDSGGLIPIATLVDSDDKRACWSETVFGPIPDYLAGFIYTKNERKNRDCFPIY